MLFHCHHSCVYQLPFLIINYKKNVLFFQFLLNYLDSFLTKLFYNTILIINLNFSLYGIKNPSANSLKYSSYLHLFSESHYYIFGYALDLM